MFSMRPLLRHTCNVRMHDNYMGNLVRKGEREERRDSYTNNQLVNSRHAFFLLYLFLFFSLCKSTFHTYASCHDVGIGVKRERERKKKRKLASWQDQLFCGDSAHSQMNQALGGGTRPFFSNFTIAFSGDRR